MVDRYEYREMVTLDLGIVHVVWDLWNDKVRTTLASKYACKRYIKDNQEEREE